jgi:hypothetical protein
MIMNRIVDLLIERRTSPRRIDSRSDIFYRRLALGAVMSFR